MKIGEILRRVPERDHHVFQTHVDMVSLSRCDYRHQLILQLHRAYVRCAQASDRRRFLEALNRPAGVNDYE